MHFLQMMHQHIVTHESDTVYVLPLSSGILPWGPVLWSCRGCSCWSWSNRYPRTAWSPTSSNTGMGVNTASHKMEKYFTEVCWYLKVNFCSSTRRWMYIKTLAKHVQHIKKKITNDNTWFSDSWRNANLVFQNWLHMPGVPFSLVPA